MAPRASNLLNLEQVYPTPHVTPLVLPSVKVTGVVHSGTLINSAAEVVNINDSNLNDNYSDNDNELNSNLDSDDFNSNDSYSDSDDDSDSTLHTHLLAYADFS